MVEKFENTVDLILFSDFDRARTECGRLLHTLQDFYSRSNWVESGKKEILHSLGRVNADLGLLANVDTETCIDCNQESVILRSYIYNFLALTFRLYSCHGNLRNNNHLTSGYRAGQRDKYGQVINKPRGKCSRGEFLDVSRDKSPTGGINKDTPFEVMSPHFYLHREAASLALKASIELLQRIRRAVGNDNLFSMFLGLSLVEEVRIETASIAYVIDTTGSMSEELPEIQASIPQIRSNLEAYARNLAEATIIRYILVPFNDPGKFRSPLKPRYKLKGS